MQPLQAAQRWATAHPELDAHIYVKRWGTRGTLTTEYWAHAGQLKRDRDALNCVCEICGRVRFDQHTPRRAGRPDPRAGLPVLDHELRPGRRNWPWLRWADYTITLACPACIAEHELTTDFPVQRDTQVAVYLCRRDPAARFSDAPYSVEISLLADTPQVQMHDRADWQAA